MPTLLVKAWSARFWLGRASAEAVAAKPRKLMMCCMLDMLVLLVLLEELGMVWLMELLVVLL